MTVGLYCLLGFGLWTILIVVLGIGRIRLTQVLVGEAKATDFPADVAHGSPGYRRILRAHANCVENLPLFGAVTLTAAITGRHGGMFDTLPIVYLGARVCQSTTHIASGSAMAINVRFSFFVVQLVCVCWLGFLLAF